MTTSQRKASPEKVTSGIEIPTWIEQKWVRGISHLRSVEDLIAGYGAAGNVWLDHELSEDRFSVMSILRVVAMPPLEQMSLCLGDAVHNFRSALDSLAWALCHLGGRSPEKPRQVSFPCEFEKSQWKSHEKNLSSMPPIFLERIKSVQPFSIDDAFSPLELLSKLSNQDKHREMITSLATLSMSSLVVNINTGGATGTRNGITDGFRIEPLHPAMTLIDHQPLARIEMSVPVSLNATREPIDLNYQILLDGKSFSLDDVKMSLLQLGNLINFVKVGS